MLLAHESSPLSLPPLLPLCSSLTQDLPISDSTDPVDRLGLTVLLRMHLHKGVADSANPTDLLVRIAKLVTSVPAAYTRTSSSNTSTRVNNISTGPFASTVTPATIVQAAATATATALHTPAAPVVVPPAASTHIVQHSPTPIASSVSPSHMSKHMHDNKSSGKQKSGVFFDNIASQALLLMMDMVRRSGSAELEEGSSYIMRVCVLMTARIAHMAPQSAHTCILLPLAGLLKPVADEKPADGSIKSNGSNSGSSRDSGLRTSCGDEGQGAMKEEGGGDVSTCVRVLHWVVTCFPLSSPILQALGSTDIVSSLLSLQVHLLLHVSSPVAVLASDMKVLVADICIKLLRNIPDPASIVYTLEDLIVHGLKYGYSYSSSRGSDGGVVVAVDRASVQEEGEGGRLGAGEGGEMDFLSCLLREAQTSFGGDTDVSPGDIHQTDLMSLAGQMNALVQRSEAVCRILSSTLAAASKEGGDGHQRPMTEPAETTTTAARSNRGNTKPKSSLIVDRDEGGLDSNKAARIASLLFLRALSGYLGLCVPQGEGSEPESNPPSSSGLPPPHICGATLLVLKDNMSLEILLHDAAEIIQLLGFFLENRANDIRRTANYGDRRQSLFTGGDSNGQYAEGDSAYVQQLLSSSHNSKGGERPLIEEITTSAENRKKEQPSAENKPYHDDSNAFKSLNNLSLFDTNQDEEDGEEEEEEEGEGEDIISTVMALLVSMLEMGSRSRRAAEETLLRDTLLPHLVTIAGGDNNVDVAQTASDLCLLIMTRNTTPKKRASADKEEPREGVGGDAVSPFHSVCDEVRSEYLFDESPAMRGLGVRTLIIALREPPEPLSAADLQEASCLLLHLLQDPESFVYLNAIHAIGRLIDHHRTQLFKTFLSYYAVGLVPHAPLVAAPSSAFASSSSSCAGPQAKGVRKGAGHYQLSLRHRAVLSEAIGCALRRADQLAHQHVPAVVAACLQICRRRTHLQSTLNSANADDSKGTSLIDVDLTAMRVAVVTVEEESGGYDGPNSTQTQDQAQARVSAANREATVQQVCESADEVLFRQSAFSLLAEAIGLAGLTVRHHLPDVVDVAIGALRHETSTVNNSYDNVKDVIPVRRSAIFLLRYIVSGLEKHLFAVDAVGSHLKEIYRTLKVTARDKDDVVKFHAECGLAAVDAVMRAQLTLSEAQLTGEDLPKIRVIR